MIWSSSPSRRLLTLATLFSSRLPYKKDREVGRCVEGPSGQWTNMYDVRLSCESRGWVTCKSATARVPECDALGWIPEAVANVDTVPQEPCKSVQDVHPPRRAQHTLSHCRGWTWQFAKVSQKLIPLSVPSRRIVTAATLSSQVTVSSKKGFPSKGRRRW